MKAYKHVLIATALLEKDRKAADKAVQIAKNSNARLSIAHIIEFNPIMYGGGDFAIPMSGDIEQSIQKIAQEKLTEEAQRLNIAEGNQFLKFGATAEALVELVKENQVDLLVLGSHEQHGLSFLLGSTAGALLHEMPCDVLAVHQ